MNEFAKRRTWGPQPRYPLVEAYEHPHNDFIIIAGPCSVEGTEQIREVAHVVRPHATHLRGGVFRAGTYPGKNFGYISEDIIKDYSGAAYGNGLKCIIEVLDYSPEPFEMVMKHADCFQIGCRSTQNYTLLRKVGASGKPVFLKRHPGSTLDEFLGAAEHVLTAGCKELYLIERGSSTHLNHVRWDLSISIIPAIKAMTKIPIIVDGSHGTGRRDLVAPMTLAGIAAGADGLLVETHPTPDRSISDSEQALSFQAFEELMIKVNKVREAIK